MQVWKEFEENEVTHSMAHYLMAIGDLHRRQGYARVTDIARELEITPGSASVSLKTLKARGYVSEDHNKFLRLSTEGERLASSIHASNRAFLTFLTEVLGVTADQASIDACKIEHLLSPETREKMLHFMHFCHSRDKRMKPLIEAFRKSPLECPGHDACDVCDTEACALSCPVHEHPHK